MAERFLSARVPEELKRQVKTIAAQKDQSVQDFIGQIVVAYLNDLQQSSRVEALGPDQQSVVDVWAAALLRKEPAAQSIYQIMELWNARWIEEGYGKQPGASKAAKDIG